MPWCAGCGPSLAVAVVTKRRAPVLLALHRLLALLNIKHLTAFTQGYALQLAIIVCRGKVSRHVKVLQTADHAQVHGALHNKPALGSRNTTCGSRRNSGRESREEGTTDDSCHDHMHSQVDELQDAAQLLSSRAHMS